MGLIYVTYIPCEGPATIPNHVDDSRNQVESLAKSLQFWNQESEFHYYFCKV